MPDRDTDTGQLQQRRVPIDAIDRHGADATWSGHTRRLDVIRFTNATLPLPTFTTTQRRIASRVGIPRRHTAVVRGEADDSIFIQAKLVEFIQHDPDSIIHRLDHPSVNRAILHLTNIKPAIELETLRDQASGLSLLTVFFPQFGRGLDRPVYRVKRKEGKERLVLVFLDELGGLVTQSNWQRLARRTRLKIGIFPW